MPGVGEWGWPLWVAAAAVVVAVVGLVVWGILDVWVHARDTRAQRGPRG